MRTVLRLFAIAIFSYISTANSYPIVDAVAGLPSPELVTVYPDEADPHLYYFLPTTIELVRDADGKPRLGVQYWGFTGADPAGLGAALTFSVRPAFDRQSLQAVADALRKTDPSARWAAIPVICSRMRVIINGAFYVDKQKIASVQTTPANLVPDVGASAAAVPPVVASGVMAAPEPGTCDSIGATSEIASKGGTVDATQAFSINLSNVGARAFALGVAPDMDVLGAEYVYVFRGVGKRLHAKITVNMRRIYEHFKARGSANAWWGVVQTSWSNEWQTLTQNGDIKIEYLQGGSSSSDDYMMEVFKQIINQKIAGEGIFKPELQPAGIASPESARMGWGFSGGGGWEKLDEKKTDTYEIQKQSLEEREFSVALSFNPVCAKYPNNFADLTTIGKKCIDENKFEEVSKKSEVCVDRKLAVWKKRLDDKLITESVWEKQSTAILDVPCY